MITRVFQVIAIPPLRRTEGLVEVLPGALRGAPGGILRA